MRLSLDGMRGREGERRRSLSKLQPLGRNKLSSWMEQQAPPLVENGLTSISSKHIEYHS